LTLALVGTSGHAPAALYPRENDPLVPLDRRLGGPQSWSEQRLEEKSSLPLPAIETPSPGSPICSHKTTLTELSQFLITIVINYKNKCMYNEHSRDTHTLNFISDINKHREYKVMQLGLLTKQNDR
jgi:hypothetical protein